MSLKQRVIPIITQESAEEIELQTKYETFALKLDEQKQVRRDWTEMDI